MGFSRQEQWSGLPFPLQCMKVKSESEVIQSCPTLCDAMDYSLPGSSVRGIFQARVLEWVAIAFSSECLPRLFHVMVALGGTHLVQESHLRKAQSIGHLELKGSSSLRTWKENRDV